MPKSKRDKDVSLTKVKKKPKESKAVLIDEIRKCIDTYRTLFVFTVENMRTNKFIDIRQQFKADSRFFFAKNTLMAIALGRTKASEYRDGLYRVSKRLNGQCGLMFTNRDEDAVIEFFRAFQTADYARSGHLVDTNVTLTAGPLLQFPFSMEPQLRKLGMPTKLDKGSVVLSTDYEVCKAGDKLTPEQSRILKMFERQLATFSLSLVSKWSTTDGYRSIVSRKVAPVASKTKKKRDRIEPMQT